MAYASDCNDPEFVGSPRIDLDDGEAWRRPAYIVVGILISIIVVVVVVWVIAANVIPST